jgi:hypothetical protein
VQIFILSPAECGEDEAAVAEAEQDALSSSSGNGHEETLGEKGLGSGAPMTGNGAPKSRSSNGNPRSGAAANGN